MSRRGNSRFFNCKKVKLTTRMKHFMIVIRNALLYFVLLYESTIVLLHGLYLCTLFYFFFIVCVTWHLYSLIFKLSSVLAALNIFVVCNSLRSSSQWSCIMFFRLKLHLCIYIYFLVLLSSLDALNLIGLLLMNMYCSQFFP